MRLLRAEIQYLEAQLLLGKDECDGVYVKQQQQRMMMIKE